MPPDANLAELATAVARMEGRLDVLLWVAGGVGALLLLFVGQVFVMFNRLSNLGAGLASLEARLGQMEARLEGFVARLEGIGDRLDSLEQGLSRRV